MAMVVPGTRNNSVYSEKPFFLWCRRTIQIATQALKHSNSNNYDGWGGNLQPAGSFPSDQVVQGAQNTSYAILDVSLANLKIYNLITAIEGSCFTIISYRNHGIHQAIKVSGHPATRALQSPVHCSMYVRSHEDTDNLQTIHLSREGGNELKCTWQSCWNG